MKKTKVFKSGNSLAVRIPKNFAVNSDEVEIFKKGKDIILRPVPKRLGRAFELLTKLPSDFLAEGRKDSKPQKREAF